MNDVSLIATTIDVLVIGAGPVGLALTNDLLRRGIDCRLIDSAPHATQKTKAVGVMPRTLELFAKIGLEFVGESFEQSFAVGNVHLDWAPTGSLQNVFLSPDIGWLEGGTMDMTDPKPALNYQARRALLARAAPGYCQASFAEKSLLLDACVQMTGYTRKHAIRLLNHAPEGKSTIQRVRLPHYGTEVQQALFLAWKAAHYTCAKRLIPSLPTLVVLLERDGHLQLTEEAEANCTP